jgi:alpha-glucosidase
LAQRGSWPANPVIYQVYPRSFQDSTGTGEGDLPGITDRLGHIADLGVDAIWLAPFFVSPMCDGGYDVADHCAVDPRFGTLDDFDALVARAHELGIKVMIDQVFNHTSDTHEWFRRSLARDPDFEDFYVWADARPDGSPPSNWMAFFGHPAWKWHPQRAQYCLHQFLPCQPGLNHYNPRVHGELSKITRFWADRGVDGFRFDAITCFYNDMDFGDNPAANATEKALIPGPSSNPFTWQIHERDMLPKDCAAFAADLRGWAGNDRFLLGEINNGPRSVEFARMFTEEGRLDAAYTVDLPERGISHEVVADVLKRLGQNHGLAWWLNCHDQKRHVSSAGDGGARDARMFAGFLLAMPGPLMMFQGDELGQPQADLALNDMRDPFDRMYWPDPPGRSGTRTPMVWDGSDGHGFTDAKPWLPFAPPADGAADAQAGRDGSVLEFHRHALALRRKLGLGAGRLFLEPEEPNRLTGRIEREGAAPVWMVLNLDTSPAAPPEAVEGSECVLASAPRDDGVLSPRSASWWTRDT